MLEIESKLKFAPYTIEDINLLRHLILSLL